MFCYLLAGVLVAILSFLLSDSRHCKNLTEKKSKGKEATGKTLDQLVIISSLSGYLTTRHLYSIFTKIPNFYHHIQQLSPLPWTSKNFPFEKAFPRQVVSTPPGVILDLQQHCGIILRRRHGRRRRQLLTSCRWYQGLGGGWGPAPTFGDTVVSFKRGVNQAIFITRLINPTYGTYITNFVAT